MSERHDWLNLIEVSGPFLSIPVLDEAFPQGLEGRDKRDAARLRQAYDEWREAVDVDDPSLDELHRAWVDEVLATALQMGDRDLRHGDQIGDALHVSLPEHGVTLTPDIVLVNVNDPDKPLLPMFVQPPNAPLDEVVHRDGWAVSPAERMVQYLRGVDCPIGLVTNGERWMLVHAPTGQVTSFVSWYARLWSQEPETLRAFVSLLAVPRFYGPEEGQLPSLFAKSEKHQDEVTEALGDQVRTAIEVLIQAIDKANQDRNGKLLEGVTPQELYEGGLTVMMRLVFILSAEERGLLLLGNTTYDNHYALSTFRQRLRRVSSDAHELLERRHSGWSRLLALFRAIYGGIEHSDLRLPAMGGSLFDPDRYPFLEGRAKGSSWFTDAADPLPIDDRTVLLMLDAIQSFEGRTLSYRALDVEQIGHVYEGLLERTVRQIDEVTLELKGSSKAKSPKATLSELAEAGLDGQETLIELLKERSGRSVSALRKDLQRTRDDRLSSALLTACRGDVDLLDRVEPYVHLMALDPWGHPRLYHPGAYAVVMGNDRRETGTHYTPKSLTEKIVHETLTPVAYAGPAEGKPKEEWRLKSPAELLDLKVCDPAMGSGAFLVQACRWLGERLVEAWSQAEALGGVVSADGEVLQSAGESELLPRDVEERTVIARRLVSERCLYGVDMNPLAVELAKLSIWLVTLAERRPFGFLDHNLRCGDSLLGIACLEQLTELRLEPSEMRQSRLFGQSVREALDKALVLRRQLRETQIRDIHDVEAMAALDTKARKQLELPEHLADALIGAIFDNSSTKLLEEQLSSLAIQADEVVQGDAEIFKMLVHQASHALAKDSPDGSPRRPFHWPLEFPEVFQRENGGFHAIVGNPPFLGGKRITGVFGDKYRDWIVHALAGSVKGSADLVAYFFLRAYSLLCPSGTFGLIAVNTISEGDTRQVGLESLLKSNAVIYAAYPNEPWPGSAAVVTSRVHVIKGLWESFCSLSGVKVSGISAFLSSGSDFSPKKLSSNLNLAFQGNIPLGEGFVISPNKARIMLDVDYKNSEVVLPFINGKDLNSSPNQTPSRYVINFWDWPEEKAKEYLLPYQWISEHVYQERMEKSKKKSYKDIMSMWWKHWRARSELYSALGRGDMFISGISRTSLHQPLDHVIGISRVSKYLSPVLMPNEWIYSLDIFIFPFEDYGRFAFLQSSLHDIWARRQSSTQGLTMRYSASDAFETLPLPSDFTMMEGVGESYDKVRRDALFSTELGLTKLYNCFHSPACEFMEIESLRRQQVLLDACVLKVYGWDDIELNHDFHEVNYLPKNDCIRFTIAESARHEILSRLSGLNLERYSYELDGNRGNAQNANLQSANLQKKESGFSQYGLAFNDSQEEVEFSSRQYELMVYEFLKNKNSWCSKKDVLLGGVVPENKWSGVISELVRKGEVIRQGERRGARYRAIVRNDQ